MPVGFFGRVAKMATASLWPDDLDAIVAKPHLIGMTRELALARTGSWIGSLFLLYQPPQIGFSRSEQRLLLSAMHGRTDQEAERRDAHLARHGQENVALDL